MKFNIDRDTLLPILQIVSNLVDRRQTLPILSNLLFSLQPGSLSITATNMEVELIVDSSVSFEETGDVTLPARKLFDICRALPQGAKLQFEVKNDRILIKSGKSRFTLVSLPSQEYPLIEIKENIAFFKVQQKKLEKILVNTQFAMAQQDVRYYLNGLLLEISRDNLKAVATDGHRLALDETDIEAQLQDTIQIIVPRKGIIELTRLLQDNDNEIDIEISTNHIRVKKLNLCFTSKLIDGKFPDYRKVIPELSETPVIANREELKNSLTRASILSNEKYRGVRVILSTESLKALAHNPELEEAEEELAVQYQGKEIEIGFNVSYLLDALSIVKSETVRLSVLDSDSSCSEEKKKEKKLLILPEDGSRSQFVVMPMRL